MKLLINNKEIAQFIAESIDYLSVVKQSGIEVDTVHEKIFKNEFITRYSKKKPTFDKKIRIKFYRRIKKAVETDVSSYAKNVKNYLKKERKQIYLKILDNVEYFIKKIGEDKILSAYKKSNTDNFVKSVGISLDSKAQLVRRKNYQPSKEDCVFRNMVGNESMILNKIQQEHPFWFIDSGYTNFLHGKQKIWHRLVRNNVHQTNIFEAPVDRLGVFETFPRQWRDGGEKILIIEPGASSAGIYGVDIEQWKDSVIRELREYTDRPIVVREKINKKVRKKLYQELLDEDYYCVININSAAAIESIWAGVPVITLHDHVSTPVARNKISDINDLYRPNLANWLCMLSYSQFTYEELIDGTAAEIIKKYHV